MAAREPLRKERGHNLLTAELRKALPPLYTNESLDDPLAAVAHVKFFGRGRYKFFVTEFDGDDTLYGYCISPLAPDCDEWGYASFAELVNMRDAQFKILAAIERDCYWEPCTVREALAS